MPPNFILKLLMINDSTNYHNFATEKHIIILYFQVNQKYKKKANFCRCVPLSSSTGMCRHNFSKLCTPDFVLYFDSEKCSRSNLFRLVNAINIRLIIIIIIANLCHQQGYLVPGQSFHSCLLR